MRLTSFDQLFHLSSLAYLCQKSLSHHYHHLFSFLRHVLSMTFPFQVQLVLQVSFHLPYPLNFNCWVHLSCYYYCWSSFLQSSHCHHPLSKLSVLQLPLIWIWIFSFLATGPLTATRGCLINILKPGITNLFPEDLSEAVVVLS